MLMYFVDRFFLKQPRLRRFVTRLLEGNRTTDVRLLGATLTVHSVEEHGYLRSSRLANRSVFLREEAPIIVNLASLLCDGDTFVDIGANVGVYTLTLARLRSVLRGLRFYAFEPNPGTYARLASQAKALGVQTHNLALADHDGVLEFVGGAVSHVFTTVEHASEYSLKSAPRISVPCRRLDRLELEGGSMVLKIDVEGQELAVLEGAKGLFDAGRVKAVYIDGYKSPSVEQFLIARGFRLLDGKSLEPKTEASFGVLAVRGGRPEDRKPSNAGTA